MSLNLPIDTAKLTFILAGDIEPAERKGQPQLDDSGRQVVKVPLIVRGASRTPEVITVKVPHTNAMDKLSDLAIVNVKGLAARPYEFDGRSGVSYSAEAVTAASA